MRDNLSAYNAGVYDSSITMTLPYYKEYHFQIIDLVKALDIKKIKWLDTGCGTGTLGDSVLNSLGNVELTMCDPSEKMISLAKEKLSGYNIEFLNISSQEIEFKDKFDIVTAVQCHHYLHMTDREEATKKCYEALKEQGIYVTFENIRMSTDESDIIALKRWEKFLRDNGKSEEEVKMHISRRGSEVFPITIEQHISLMKKCGFKSVNLLWASYLQAGFWAVK